MATAAKPVSTTSIAVVGTASTARSGAQTPSNGEAREHGRRVRVPTRGLIFLSPSRARVRGTTPAAAAERASSPRGAGAAPAIA